MGYSRVSKAVSRCFFWLLVGVVGLGVALGCTVAVGAGVGAAMLGGAALTAGCYDPINVTVFDGVTGLRACDAKVVARSTDGAEAAFSSCFHAELPVGTWTVSADRLGYQPVSAGLVVSKRKGCEPSVQSIEISLLPVGISPAAPVAVRPLRPGEAPLAPGALPPPASIAVDPAAPTPVPAAPPVSSSTAASAPPPVVPPASNPSPAPSAVPPGSNPSSPPSAVPPAAPPAGSAAPSPPAPAPAAPTRSF